MSNGDRFENIFKPYHKYPYHRRSVTSGLVSEAQQRGESNGHSSRTDKLLTMRRSVPMGDTPRKALSASVSSSSVTQREWCGFVRAHLVSVVAQHANAIFSPTRLPRQPMPPNSSTRARWNRLEQPELASQAAARRGAVRARLIRFVRARGLPVAWSAACRNSLRRARARRRAAQ